ncbi:Cyclin-D2-1 [Hibiscus syriacus]|uniref:Cyclin-D2-1 n=1 Tax=Hibiscus syriacus TaxID=106335 RepID=A0A6A2ZW74_HIBSY|nr:Cyclin-D2-1 [Hibiscus syriacus]
MTFEEFESLDILAWWKEKEAQFPILPAMARDLLTVQASTVASESAFSVSGRVISQRRSRLSPESVEVCICLKDYLDGAARKQHITTLEDAIDADLEANLHIEEVELGISLQTKKAKMMRRDGNGESVPLWGNRFPPSILEISEPNHSVRNRSTSLMGCSDFEIQSDDRIREMVEKEVEHLPEDDYLNRLRTGEVDLSVRREAFDWVWKASGYYHFGPSSLCLAINYLDRFLAVYDLPRGKTWTVQLLAVACLSIAAKMEETEVPLLVDLQVGEPKFVFEAKTICRMEVLVLSTLKWKMQAITPCSFIGYFLSKSCNDQSPSSISVSRSLQLIINTINGIDFLEFRPSEIAAAVAISVSGEMQTAIDKAISSFTFVQKGRVLKCVELMKDLSFINGAAPVATQHPSAAASSTVPQSPIGVLDAAACQSYKSDEITAGSSASPDIKRRKHEDDDNTTSRQDSHEM